MSLEYRDQLKLLVIDKALIGGLILFADCVRDRFRLAVVECQQSSDHALQFGELPDGTGDEIGFGKQARAAYMRACQERDSP